MIWLLPASKHSSDSRRSDWHELHAWNPAAAERQPTENAADAIKKKIHHSLTMMLTRCYATQVVHRRTNTSSTHSDVQTHIPLVGSWSEVRKCEICQPIGDWVIEEYDSERNILLPWWWTRRNNTTFSRRRKQETQVDR